MLKSQFLFMSCQINAENSLKQELSQNHPNLKFAYSKPGFLTFKSTQGLDLIALKIHSTFARTYGLCIKKFKTIQELLTYVTELSLTPEPEITLPLNLHVWERDQHAPEEAPKNFIPNALARQITSQISENLSAFPKLQIQLNKKAKRNDLIFNAIVISEPEIWLGAHLHNESHPSFVYETPGCIPEIIFPKKAPSRAYLKCEESLVWSQLPLKPKETAVEMGSAPGGAAWSLLQKGLWVLGVDPGEMSETVLKNPSFKHLKMPISQVSVNDLPPRVDWVFLDINSQPEITLQQLEQFLKKVSFHTGHPPKGLILTLKLNQWELSKNIPDYLEKIKSFGMRKVRARQLYYNKQEICVFAVSR